MTEPTAITVTATPAGPAAVPEPAGVPKSAQLRERLVARRKAYGLSISAAAQLVGVGRSTLSMYESGDTHGTVDFVARYAEALGLKLEVVYDGPQGVVQKDGEWMFEGITYPTRRAARDAAGGGTR